MNPSTSGAPVDRSKRSIEISCRDLHSWKLRGQIIKLVSVITFLSDEFHKILYVAPKLDHTHYG